MWLEGQIITRKKNFKDAFYCRYFFALDLALPKTQFLVKVLLQTPALTLATPILVQSLQM